MSSVGQCKLVLVCHLLCVSPDPPSSKGGAPILHYTIESCTETLPWKIVGVASGDAFESHDQSLVHTVDTLVPGCTYRFRVQCQSSAGVRRTPDEVFVAVRGEGCGCFPHAGQPLVTRGPEQHCSQCAGATPCGLGHPQRPHKCRCSVSGEQRSSS